MLAALKSSLVCLLALLLFAACAQTPPQLPGEKDEYWGLPNLVIQAFIPPVILAGEGDTIYISDLTANIGDNVSQETTIRYYISAASPVDVATAVIIGERQVRELKPGERDESMEKPYEIPEGAGSPPLFLAACVDIDNIVGELVEDDNCTTSPAGADQMIFDSGAVTPR